MGKRAPCAVVFLQYLLFIILFCSHNSISTESITRSEGISVGETLISSGQVFELGFFSPGNSGRRYVGIWYYNISKLKPVWVANRESPIAITDNSSSLVIGDDGNLKILDGKGNMVWSTNISSPSNDTVAVLSDQGKLSLEDSVKRSSLWDSFRYPGDTFIVGMSLSANRITGEKQCLSSWKSDDDPSNGNYTSGITTETPPQSLVWKNSKPYRRSGPWDGWKFVGLHDSSKGYANGLIVAQNNQQGTTCLSYDAQVESNVIVMVLTFDGDVKRSLWDIHSFTGELTWTASQVIPCEIYATCGPFGNCDRVKTRTCKCLKGYVPKSTEEWNNKDWTSGCVLRAELPCQRNITTSLSDKAKSDGFWQLSNMKVPDHHIYLNGLNTSSCQKRCLSNCSCLAYAYPDGIGCLIWVGDLIDSQKLSGFGADIFIRVADSELAGHKKMMKHVIILATVLATIFPAAFLLVVYKCAANHRATRRRRTNQIQLAGPVGRPIRGTRGYNLKHHMTKGEQSELPMFEFTTLAIATDNFSETNKLGAGGFGSVYWGKLEDGQEIAVKRLSSYSGQGAVEFKNEIVLISELKHRNLVRLHGFCIEGDEKLLVYEYLKNKSLDTILFDTSKKKELDWIQRFNIIVGIARGLLYLHRDSSLRIIHRDLKAGNILLDDNMNPKISDFGLARAFHITQELTNTQRVVGTFGYISPEYAVGGLFSEKSDIYSFGVLVLEIISGMKITSSPCKEEYLNLQGHAWKLWEEGKGLTLLDDQLSTSYSESEFLKCLRTGLLCIQDHAVDRPTMSSVVLMLTSDVPIPEPKQPKLCQGLMSSHYFNTLFSTNGVTLSIVEGR